MFRRDSRLFIRSLKYILIIGCILLAGAAGTILLIVNNEAGGSKPLTLALVNEDTESSFSDLVLSVVAENENIASSVDVEFFDTEEGRNKFEMFLRAFVDLEIPHIQFNVVRKEDLIAAKKNPEQYRSLTVRVAGYTAYFTELAGKLQDEIIARTVYEDIS